MKNSFTVFSKLKTRLVSSKQEGERECGFYFGLS